MRGAALVFPPSTNLPQPVRATDPQALKIDAITQSESGNRFDFIFDLGELGGERGAGRDILFACSLELSSGLGFAADVHQRARVGERGPGLLVDRGVAARVDLERALEVRVAGLLVGGHEIWSEFQQRFARFRLYRLRSLQVNTRFLAFVNLQDYQAEILKFGKLLQMFAKCPKVC